MRKLGLIAVVLAAGVIATYVALHWHQPAPVPPARPIVTTRPATRPAKRPRPKPPVYASYMDAVRASNPAVAATQPLGTPVELQDAAHVVLRDPVYVDPAGNLWVTRADGQPTERLLAHLPDGPELVVRDRPAFVHWWADENGTWAAGVVLANPGGGYDLVTSLGHRRFAGDRPYRWADAYSVQGRVVVPTDVGVSVFDVGPDVVEHFHPLPACAAGATNPPATVLDGRGVLAWSPWEGGRPGGRGASRFVDGRWSDLPATDWPDRLVQLVGLLDGSVLRIAAGPPTTPAAPAVESLDADPPTTAPATALPAGPADRVNLSIAQLEPATVADAAHVDQLVGRLSDGDGDVRQAAFEELSRYGPALWPVLERAAADQPPEGQVRIRQLLRGKITPALGGMRLVDDRLDVARRQADGTTILYAPAGVEIPTDRPDGPQVVNPAWLTLRPGGRVDRPLPPALVRDQAANDCTLRAVADEWLVVDAAGPRRFFGNALVPMLPAGEARFTQFVALAARHRWVFRDPKTGETLVVDPTIADPTPRLPVWTITVTGGVAGWDDHGNPAIRHGGLVGLGGAAGSAGQFALDAEGWTALGPIDVLHTEAPPRLPAAATGPTTGPAGRLLLTMADGTRYFDGRETLTAVNPGGQQTRWPLPATAVAAPGTDPVLMRTDDGLLFLYNAPGRLLRVRPTPGGPEPFKLEATFTADLPEADHPTRVWLDPAGRIDFVCDRTTLAVTFPAGHIPKAISDMMPDVRR